MEENLTLIFGEAERATLAVRGKDRALFLHRLLTQDIKGMSVGQVRPACLLDRLGKIQLAVLISVQPEEILLELCAERAESDRALLEKYRISEQVQLAFSKTGTVSEKTDCQRISAGVPGIGKELTPEVIPNELGSEWLERFVSFTKGCYVGQEIVARIKHRAHPPRLLAGFVMESSLAPMVGSPILLGGEPAGVVTSSCLSPALGKPIALGFLKYGVEGENFQIQDLPARKVNLPFVSGSS
ncbi:MAG: glycine cleavage T C-terminal barrel domain-containing protein [Candidatus Omnitrophota bacterium]|nr:glycine cleavage T C-terminal barrel domain-containing protein [Candidatus Omnitrophota bacterium]